MMEKGKIMREEQTIIAQERKVERQTICFISAFRGSHLLGTTEATVITVFTKENSQIHCVHYKISNNLERNILT